MHRDSWDVMRRGDMELALRQMRENAEELDTSGAMELGVAYLWLKDYQAAWEHFDAYNLQHPKYMDCTYGMAGVARWCLGEVHEAIKQWRVALTCDYADDTQLGTPLLLYFAAVMTSDADGEDEAKSLLEERASKVTVARWPLPLAEFVLGRIDESEVRPLCYAERYDSKEMQECETALRHWSTDFFVGVVERAKDGNVTAFEELLRRVGAASWNDFDENRCSFLGKLWSPEFFLARHEAGIL